MRLQSYRVNWRVSHRSVSHDDNIIAFAESHRAVALQMSQSTLLLRKRKEMIKVDNELEEMKRQYEKRMSICYTKQKEFEVKKKKLDQSVRKSRAIPCYKSTRCSQINSR